MEAFLRRLWVQASLFAAAAVIVALAAEPVGRWLPNDLTRSIGEEALEELLKVMSGAMLPVVTFSMATIVTAYGTVMSNASPRAAGLMMEDRSAQNALASFIGAFIFSVVSLIALGTGYFGEAARFVLFLFTLAILALVVVRLLGWIDELSRIARVGSVIDQVESATQAALRDRKPYLGGMPDAGGVVPPAAIPIFPRRVGYVQHVDMGRLQKVCDEQGFRVRLNSVPGAFVPLHRPLLHVLDRFDPLDDKTIDKLVAAATVADRRDYRQDPRNGLVVLGEVASRALSPGINDPGTAIDVIASAARVLSVWGAEHWEAEPPCDYPSVLVPPLSARDCFEDAFRPLSRDGAGMVEVVLTLQKALEDLARSEAPGFREAARVLSREALARSERALDYEHDLALVREHAAWSA